VANGTLATVSIGKMPTFRDETGDLRAHGCGEKFVSAGLNDLCQWSG